MTKTARIRRNCLCKLSLFALFTTHGICGYCQQLVQTPKDLWLICAQDERFIGKPLAALLKEFRPPITAVIPEGGHQYKRAHFTFYFASKKVFARYGSQDKNPIHITVFLKETFQWTWEGRDRSVEHYLDWLKKDEEKYRNLTVVEIRVSGAYDTCDEEQDVNL